MIIIYIILGLAAVFGIGAFIFSDKASPIDRATEAAGAAASGAAVGIGCLLQLVFAAIPIVIAIFIVLFILKSCS